MKFKIRDHELLCGVLLSALIGYVFAIALEGVRIHDFAGIQAAATATTAAPTSSAPAMASAKPPATSTR